ncbi:hypothetical protein J7643_03720 [bacterium]|nr:hypothetical protein [bacterium]
MVSLIDEQYEIRVTLSWLPVEGVRYDFEFLWSGEPIVNDAILKRINDYWNSRHRGGVFFTEYAGDRPLQALEQVLATDTPSWFEPIDPDLAWSFYPDMWFPFLKVSKTGVTELDGPRDRAQRETDPDDDYFTVAFHGDTYNFKDADAYSGHGIGFFFVVKRKELSRFLADLAAERAALINQFGLGWEP